MRTAAYPGRDFQGRIVYVGSVLDTERRTVRARVEIEHLFTLYNLPYISQVYLMFRARLLDLNFAPGPESLEVALFREEDIPWEQLAFRTVERTLRAYFADRRAGQFGFHLGDIPPPSKA